MFSNPGFGLSGDFGNHGRFITALPQVFLEQNTVETSALPPIRTVSGNARRFELEWLSPYDINTTYAETHYAWTRDSPVGIRTTIRPRVLYNIM